MKMRRIYLLHHCTVDSHENYVGIQLFVPEDCFYNGLSKNGSFSGAQLIAGWYYGRMPLVQL